jgi:hypothetical protein
MVCNRFLYVPVSLSVSSSKTDAKRVATDIAVDLVFCSARIFDKTSDWLIHGWRKLVIGFQNMFFSGFAQRESFRARSDAHFRVFKRGSESKHRTVNSDKDEVDEPYKLTWVLRRFLFNTEEIETRPTVSNPCLLF